MISPRFLLLACNKLCGLRTLICVCLMGLVCYFVINQSVTSRDASVLYRLQSQDDTKSVRAILDQGETSQVSEEEIADDHISPKVETKSKIPRVSDAPCTFSLFRRFYEDYDYFPAGGKWYTDTAVAYFQPDFCKFKHARMNHTHVAQCFSESNVKSIMTLGDSNAQRYFEALKKSVAIKKTDCHQVRREQLEEGGFLPDKIFYQPTNASGRHNEWETFIEVNYRLCSGCAGQQTVCTTSSDPAKEILFEHMSMNMLVDDTVQIHVRSKDHIRKLRQYWSPTSQETLFKYFLKGRYPDVFFMFLPFNHAKHLTNYRLYLDLQYYLGLVRHYFPKRTKVMFMPTFSEFELPRTASEWVNVTFDDMLAADKIDHINHMMFDLVKDDLLNPRSNKYGFLDLVNISKPRMDWSLDGIHMQPQWYDIIVSMLWETLCNSLQLNAF